MLVRRSDFATVLDRLASCPALAVDSETTGLRPYHNDALFSIIIHDGTEAFYFNFGTGIDVPVEAFLVERHLVALGEFFATPRTYYLHNFKFDQAMLAAARITLRGKIHDTMVIARVLDSTLLPGQFSLDSCASKIGYSKDDGVKKWLDNTGGYTLDRTKKPAKKSYHYDLVPLSIIQPYAERDAEITFRLAEWQLGRLAELDAEITNTVPSAAGIAQVYANECELVRTVYDMERRGVLVDVEYCKRAVEARQAGMLDAISGFEACAGVPFKDSAKTYKAVFYAEKDKWGRGSPTASGQINPKFDAKILETFEHPAAKCVLAYKDARSDFNFFQGFLDAADAGGVIHTNFNQHATTTGRFSSSKPNLQNLTKGEGDELDAEFVVRRAIVPRPGNVFHMLDYSQMEYRLMLDYAGKLAFDELGVMALIKQVLGGLDVHQATADLAGISRRAAKTINFATLYGSGIASLASRLEVSRSEATRLRDSIFRAAPETSAFIRRATQAAERRGYVINWFGRRCDFPDPRFAYRATNYLIQGGSADIVKLAMNRVAGYLKNFETRMLLVIHDEIILEGPPSEVQSVVPVVKAIMEQAYPYKHVPMTCSVDHSFTSLADKIEGIAHY